ncbi:MAG: peptide chain release factor N(5)-glutamine methyltransferase [Betaproteobacteria bacterium]|nr:peptide chain release factor N(5)-glutamine methyltransferase [Betaproteobacteria bacterium]
MARIADALADAQARGLERLDAQLLLLHAIGIDPAGLGAQRAWLIAHDRDALAADASQRFGQHLVRRLDGEPLAYITGHKEFFGLDLRVDARVLVPRPDTETLVDWTLELLPQPGAEDPLGLRILDLGTGSGAVALALKHSRPDAQLHALDAFPEALSVATANAVRLGLQVHFIHSDWLAQVDGRYHCIVANPPYIAGCDPHLAALRHEPLQALAAGPQGLDDIRRIVLQARAHLHPGGWLLLEHGFEQAPAVRALLGAAGYRSIASRCDLAGHARCTGAQRGPD